MVIVSPQRIGLFPFQVAFSSLINGGDSNHLQVMGWSSKYPTKAKGNGGQGTCRAHLLLRWWQEHLEASNPRDSCHSPSWVNFELRDPMNSRSLPVVWKGLAFTTGLLQGWGWRKKMPPTILVVLIHTKCQSQWELTWLEIGSTCIKKKKVRGTPFATGGAKATMERTETIPGWSDNEFHEQHKRMPDAEHLSGGCSTHL